MDQQGGSQQSILQLAFPIVLFIGIFYFMIIRPQRKKQQQHDKMLASITRGDTVITAGGFFGKVSDILDDSYIIELTDGVKARILKSSISIRRDPSEGGAKPPRPKKKDRQRRSAQSGEKQDDAAPGLREEGVTSEETSALVEDEATPSEENAAASQESVTSPENTEKTEPRV